MPLAAFKANPDLCVRHAPDDNPSTRRVVLAFVGGFIVVATLWFFFASGYWELKGIEVSDLKTLQKGEVQNEVDRVIREQPWRPWKKTNLLLLDENHLAGILKERLFVDQIRVEKKYPGILRLIIKERQRSVILAANTQVVNVDAMGIVTSVLQGQQLDDVKAVLDGKIISDANHAAVIHTYTDDPLAADFQVAPMTTVRKWLDVIRELQNQGVRLRYINLERPDSELFRVVSEAGYEIYFDLGHPLQAQLDTYLTYLKSKPDPKNVTSYIDVRVPGKIYLK